MTATTYRLTCRPAWAENVPAGFTSLTSNPEPRPGDYGTVAYPEALPRERAEHFSLAPTGPALPTITWDGSTYDLLEILGSAESASWEYRTGVMDATGLAAVINATFADHDIPPADYEIVWT